MKKHLSAPKAKNKINHRLQIALGVMVLGISLFLTGITNPDRVAVQKTEFIETSRMPAAAKKEVEAKAEDKKELLDKETFLFERTGIQTRKKLMDQ